MEEVQRKNDSLQSDIHEMTLQHTREQEALRQELILQGCFPMRRTSGLLPVTTVGFPALPALTWKCCSTLQGNSLYRQGTGCLYGTLKLGPYECLSDSLSILLRHWLRGCSGSPWQ